MRSVLCVLQVEQARTEASPMSDLKANLAPVPAFLDRDLDIPLDHAALDAVLDAALARAASDDAYLGAAVTEVMNNLRESYNAIAKITQSTRVAPVTRHDRRAIQRTGRKNSRRKNAVVVPAIMAVTAVPATTTTLTPQTVGRKRFPDLPHFLMVVPPRPKKAKCS